VVGSECVRFHPLLYTLSFLEDDTTLTEDICIPNGVEMEIMTIVPVVPPPLVVTKGKPHLFDPCKNLMRPDFKAKVRALANTPFTEIPKNDNIFNALWPGIALDTVAPTVEKRVALGVVALLAHLSTVSSRVHALLDQAPAQPNYVFHIANALFATIKCTAKPVTDVEASTYLLKQTLTQLITLSKHIPDMGKPSNTAPFPVFALFTHSVIDLLACTPRLTVDFMCADATHSHGYRVQGHFLDALHVAPDEHATLASILTDFEADMSEEVPAACEEGHAIHVHASYYGVYGAPPPLLFFEPTTEDGIPRRCITEHVTLGDYDYELSAVVSMEDDDMVLELGLEVSHRPVALVVYCRDEQEVEMLEEDDEEDVSDSIDSEA
jgi:hypothetical protein